MKRLFHFSILLGLSFACSKTNNSEKREVPPKQQIEKQKYADVIAESNVNYALDEELIEGFSMDSTINVNENSKVLQQLFDLDKDGLMDTIRCFAVNDLEGGPGDFHRLIVSMSNGTELIENNIDGWIRGNSSQPPTNLLETDMISIVEWKNQNLLICFGWYYASDPSSVTIYDFIEAFPRKIFHKNIKVKKWHLNDSILFEGNIKLRSPGDKTDPGSHQLKLSNSKLVLEASGFLLN